MASRTLIDRRQVFLGGRYVAHIKVYEVKKSKKFPDGIKARYVLVNADKGTPRLLVDNHEPYGYHMHTRLPSDKSHRVKLDVNQYLEALVIFLDEAKRILKDET